MRCPDYQQAMTTVLLLLLVVFLVLVVLVGVAAVVLLLLPGPSVRSACLAPVYLTVNYPPEGVLTCSHGPRTIT